MDSTSAGGFFILITGHKSLFLYDLYSIWIKLCCEKWDRNTLKVVENGICFDEFGIKLPCDLLKSTLQLTLRRRVMKEQFGKLIRDNREKKGLSQEQLAEKCDVTDKCVSNIELGKSDPKLSTAIRICVALEIDITVLKELIYTEGDGETR